MEDARKNIRKFIFAIASVLVVLLVARFFLVVLNATEDHFVTEFILGFTNPLIFPFAGMFAIASLGIIGTLLEISVAAIFYIFIGIFVSSIINSFIQDDPADIILEIIDTLFKLLEFVLIARLVMKLFGVADGTPFVDFIYSNTEWVAGLLPVIDVLGGELEFSTLFILVAVVVVDLITEGFVEGLQKRKEKNSNTVSAGNHTTVIRERVDRPVAMAQPHNITINVPNHQRAAPINPRRAQPQVININQPRHEQTLPYNRKK